MKFILNNKTFVNMTNTENGEVTGETLFHYKQSGSQVEASYSGGNIKHGHLLGVMTSETTLSMFYHHINIQNELRVGQCHSQVTIEPDGKIKLRENWQWLNGDCSKGESVLIEF